MASRGSSATATGLALIMIAVAVGVSSTSALALLLSFAGVLAGTGLIFFGIWMADDESTAPIGCPRVISVAAGARALVHCLRRNLALVGLLLASSAASVAAAERETAPILCFFAFALLLFGLSLLNLGLLLSEQEQDLEGWNTSSCPRSSVVTITTAAACRLS